MLTDLEKQLYTEKVIIPNFMHLVDQKIYSVIFDYKYEIVVCTNHSAQSIGIDSWMGVVGLSFKNYASYELAATIFDVKPNDKLMELICQYAKKIYEIQQNIFNTKNVISFVDLLPYNGKFKSFLVTYVPILHPSGEVVAIQSFSIQSKFFSHQDYLQRQLLPEEDKKLDRYAKIDKLTPREHEIMFLLANGINQEQIAQILKVSRSTVANIIANQLCIKFGIPGSNTKLLAQTALKHEYHQKVPHNLYQPCVIILDEDLAQELSYLRS